MPSIVISFRASAEILLGPEAAKTSSARSARVDSQRNQTAERSTITLEALLADRGFPVYEHLGPGEMTEQYFADYNRANPAHQMEAPKGVGYVLAVRKS